MIILKSFFSHNLFSRFLIPVESFAHAFEHDAGYTSVILKDGTSYDVEESLETIRMKIWDARQEKAFA